MRVIDEQAEDEATGDAVRAADPVGQAAATQRGTGPQAATTSTWRRGWRDLLAVVSFPLLAIGVLLRLWADPNGRILASNVDDHGVFLFFVGHGERVLFHGASLLHSDRLNVPDGVNMMANTSILALSLPVAPITHYLGVGVAVVLLLTLGLAGTAAAWYVVLARHLVRSRAAAYVGALWCGFAPAMISHANGHINIISQFVVPFIVWQVVRLREPGRVWRSGALLGVLIVLQAFINEEILLFVALTLGVFVVAYAVCDRRLARQVAGRFAAGLAVAAGLSAIVLAYPLWSQFRGAGSYRGLPFPSDAFVTDLIAPGAFARQSWGGGQSAAQGLSVSVTEDNTFFGVPVLIMLGVAVVLLRRSVAAVATMIAGLVLLVASFGSRLRVGGRDTAFPLPFALVHHLPIIDMVSVTRFGMATTTVVGLLLALAADRMTTAGARRGPAGVRGFSRPVRVAFWAALIAALVPVAPRPLQTVRAAPLPPFIADGLWREYVPEGRSLVPVPLPNAAIGREGMRWAALAHFEFPVPRGYFMGPVDPPGDVTGSWNAPLRATSSLLQQIQTDGRRPRITAADRAAAAADLLYWRAAVVVLGADRHATVLRDTLTDLLGRAPQRVGGVLLWDVRDLPVGSRTDHVVPRD